jgi:hypothetical protein
MNFKEIASPLIECGIPVTPLRPQTKIAFLPGWENSATTDIAQVDLWNSQDPTYNCGAVAKADLDKVWFFEVDSPDVIHRVVNDTGKPMPETFMVRSSPGHAHYYFKQSEASIRMGNLAQGFVRGGDWSARVHNQYVVAAGSINPTTGQPYEIYRDRMIVEGPDWFVEWCVSQKLDKKQTITQFTTGQGTIPEHYRNDVLTSIGGGYREKGLNADEIFTVLRRINDERCDPPLPESEVRTISNSTGGYTAGDPVAKVVLTYNGVAGTVPTPRVTASSLPKDAIGTTENGIPIFNYPKDEDESFEDVMSIAALEDKGDLTVEYPDPGTADLVSLFAIQLTSGTSLPLAFIRETLKNMTNQLIDGYYLHSVRPHLSLRGFHFNYASSWVGKTTAFDMVLEWMKNEFEKRGIWIRDLLSYGSRQFFVRMLSREVPLDKDGKSKWDPGNPLQLLHVKEGNRIAAEGTENKYFKSIFSVLTDLYDQTEASTGSFTNKAWVAKDVRVSSIINITPSDFRTTFEGKGSIGGGGLGRWTIAAPAKIENKKDWEKMPTDKLWATFELLRARLPIVAEKVLASSPTIVTTQPIMLTEEEGAKEIRLAVHNRMEDAGKKGVRLSEYFIREQVNRAAFSIAHPNIMTRTDAERIAAWTDAQLAARAVWPADAGTPVERHEVTIRRTMTGHLVSETRLKDACHYYRPGSGGVWAFGAALTNMLKDEIKCVGVAGKRRTLVFCPRWCMDHPRVKIR